MGFYAPAMLFGGLAVAIPLILHFFFRARHRKVPWGPMKFLKLAIEQTSRRLRFQEWLLLALRCLVLLLLAFALARPTFSGGGAGRGDAVDAVFLFDTSFSMGTRDGDGHRLERAKQAALAAIDALPPNSTVQVLACADRVWRMGPQSPGNLDAARDAVRAVQLTSLATDLLPGLEEALTAFDRGAGMNKEVWLFSDLSRGGFERQAAAVKAKAADIRSRGTLLAVRCGRAGESPVNVAITEIRMPGGIPHRGARMPFTIMLRNTGTKPATNINASLELDGRGGEREGTLVAAIPPGQTVPVTLTARLDDDGPRVLGARISGDDLSGDNRLDRVIRVRDRLNVLIVDGAPDRADPKQSASHYIRSALVPVSPGDAEDHFVRVNVVTADEAGPGLLAGCSLVVLANVPASDADVPGTPALSLDFSAALLDYVRSGGGLIIGAGSNVIPERYNAVLGSRGLRLLPYELDDPVRATPERPFTFDPDTIPANSFIGRFREEPFRTVAAEVDVMELAGMRIADDPLARVLLRTADLRPVLAARSLGSGEILFAACGLDTNWTNWPARAGSFVPFAQLALAHLTGSGVSHLNRTVGEPLTWTPPEFAAGFDLVSDSGERIRLGKPTGGGGERLAITATDVPRAGVYRFTSDDGSIVSPPFAIAPDLRESDDLEALTDRELEETLGFKPVILAAGTSAGEIAGERSRREWTVWVLIVLFAALVAEAALAWMCGKAW